MRRAGVLILFGSLATAALMLATWFVGLIVGYTAGGFLHLLLLFSVLLAPAGISAGVVLLIIAGRQQRPKDDRP